MRMVSLIVSLTCIFLPSFALAQTESMQELSGIPFYVTSFQPKDGPALSENTQPGVSGLIIQFDFKKRRLLFRAYCNSGFSDFTLDDGEKIKFSSGVTSEAFCPYGVVGKRFLDNITKLGRVHFESNVRRLQFYFEGTQDYFSFEPLFPESWIN